MTETQSAPGPVRKRRWFQFSLRGLLLLTAAVAGWLIYQSRQFAAEQAMLVQVHAVDPKAEAHWETPHWWSRLFGDLPAGVLRRVASINFQTRGLDGDKLAPLPLDQLSKLQSVAIDGPLDSDEDERDLEELWQGKVRVQLLPSYTMESFDGDFVAVYEQDSSPETTEKLKRAMRNYTPGLGMPSAEPDELSYGCIRFGNSHESAAAKLLTTPDESVRVCAAATLWKMHSRSHAQQVIDLAAGFKSTDRHTERLKKRIERDLKKENIQDELALGSQDWGAWLASLRPDPDHTKAMIEAVQSGKATLSTIYSLGKSKDPQVIPSLVYALGDQKLCGNEVVERALVPFASEELEKTLLAGIPSGNDYFSCNAASVLGEIGTAKSLPLLEKMATDPKYDNAPINVQNVSNIAFQHIRSREEDKARQEQERQAEAANVANQ